MYLDGDRDYPTLAGTGTEDYIGSAWELGEFINRTQGCTCKNGLQASFYRFHIDDEINFSDDIRVTLQAMGGGAQTMCAKQRKAELPAQLYLTMTASYTEYTKPI